MGRAGAVMGITCQRDQGLLSATTLRAYKLLLVDDIWSLIGSANLDTRSLRLNFELDLSIFDYEFATRVRQHFEQALLHAHEISLEEIENRSLPTKLRDSFFHLFSPFL